MDSSQSTSKRKSCSVSVKSLQNHDMMTEPTEGEKEMTKRRKIERNTLFMEDIVEKILSYLDVDSIKSARQVHESWSAAGAKILLSKCYVQIPLEVRTGKLAIKQREMEKFKAFLSHKFKDVSMIPKISIQGGGDFERWKSLGVLGPQVTSLELNYVDKRAKLLRRLMDLLPNLKYLILGDNLDIFKYKVAIIKVLNDVMSKSEKDGKPLVISNLSLRPFNVKELEAIEEFARSYKNILFEKFSFFTSYDNVRRKVPDAWDRVDCIVNTIRSKSQSTLKEWHSYICD